MYLIIGYDTVIEKPANWFIKGDLVEAKEVLKELSRKKFNGKKHYTELKLYKEVIDGASNRN